MVELVEILYGRLGKRSVERVRYVINNLLHLVIVKYGDISLVLLRLHKHTPSNWQKRNSLRHIACYLFTQILIPLHQSHINPTTSRSPRSFWIKLSRSWSTACMVPLLSNRLCFISLWVETNRNSTALSVVQPLKQWIIIIIRALLTAILMIIILITAKFQENES